MWRAAFSTIGVSVLLVNCRHGRFPVEEFSEPPNLFNPVSLLPLCPSRTFKHTCGMGSPEQHPLCFVPAVPLVCAFLLFTWPQLCCLLTTETRHTYTCSSGAFERLLYISHMLLPAPAPPRAFSLLPACVIAPRTKFRCSVYAGGARTGSLVERRLSFLLFVRPEGTATPVTGGMFPNSCRISLPSSHFAGVIRNIITRCCTLVFSRGAAGVCACRRITNATRLLRFCSLRQCLPNSAVILYPRRGHILRYPAVHQAVYLGIWHLRLFLRTF